MNINDFESNETEVNGIIKRIFERQEELIKKYKDIEKMPDYPFDINSKESQIWIKDFLWRAVEELSEADEALRAGHYEHFIEELIDYLHFSTEILILSGIKPDEVIDIDNEVDKESISREYFESDIERLMWETTYKLGLVGNTLKNKKWKQTQVLTDISKYKILIIDAYNTGLKLLLSSGMNNVDIYNFYFKKSEVNKFRQRSMY